MVTLKQERFVNAYFENGGNGTQAAIEAGYSGTEASLRVTAHDLLTSTNVAARIRARLAAAEVTPDGIIANLWAIAKLPHDSPILQRIEYDKGGAVKATSTDLTQVVRANEALAKIHGMGRETIDVNVNGPIRALQYLPPPGYDAARFELTARTTRVEMSDDDDNAEPQL